MTGKNPFALALTNVQLKDRMGELRERTHMGTVLTWSAWVETVLTYVLESHMPKPSGNILKELYENNGPLSTFSAKIKIARAFGFIGDELAAEINKLRAIRNKFAHTEKHLNLRSPEIVKLVSKLDTAKQHLDDPHSAFGEAVLKAASSLEACYKPAVTNPFALPPRDVDKTSQRS